MSEAEFSPNMQPADPGLTPFDVRENSGRKGVVNLFIGLGILLVLALIVYKLYQPGVRDRKDPPQITAENTPFKVSPEEIGGTQTPHQDKTVFDVMDGKDAQEVVTPAPQPEKPIDLPAPKPIKPTTPAAPAFGSTPPVEVKPFKAPSKPRSVIQSRPIKSAPPSSTVNYGNSDYVVQVASVRTQADAQDVWNVINTKFSDLTAAGLYADVRRVDLNEKGIYYRTRIAGLADKPSAAALCNAFKARGQACFVTKK